jgi:hypothetical protein
MGEDEEFMKPGKRRQLQDRLNGIEFRNRLRQLRRRAILSASIERQRTGQATTHLFERDKRA